MKIVDSTWFHPLGEQCIGMVITENDQGERKGYIGRGSGVDLIADEQHIASNGAKVNYEIASFIRKGLQRDAHTVKLNLPDGDVVDLTFDSHTITASGSGGVERADLPRNAGDPSPKLFVGTRVEDSKAWQELFHGFKAACRDKNISQDEAKAYLDGLLMAKALEG